jgi:hypothetical protein
MEEKARGDAPLVWKWVYDPEVGAIGWLLGLRVPDAAEYVPPTGTGLSFCERVEDAIADSFLACLKVLRSTPTICPISFYGKVRQNEVTEVLGHPPWDSMTTADAPRCDWAEQFDDKDLSLLTDVWSGMVKLRNLRDWMEVPFQEVFFQQISMKAKKQAETNLRGRYFSNLANAPLTEDQKDNAKDVIEALVRKESAETGWDTPYGEAFRKIFGDEEEQAFNAKTRIARAVGVFVEGVHLPQLHAFLSACLVLETLFTVGEGEVTHKFATRLAKLVGKDSSSAERRALFDRARKVYNARGDIVHGTCAISEISEDVRKDAFELARKALQTIMSQRRYLDLWMAPMSRDGRGELKEFFTHLDLG